MNIVRRRAFLLVLSLALTFIVLRLSLHFSPNSNFDVAGYNIHHLFTGLLVLTLCGIPLALFQGNNRWLDAATCGFGVGLSMALDEWVYLITTDGSDASYLLPISFWGGVTVVGLTCVYVLAIAWCAHRCRRRG